MRLVIFLVFMSTHVASFAGVKFELTHGVSALMPVVVEKFTTDGTVPTSSGDLAKIIRFDLMASGRFLAMASLDDKEVKKAFEKRRVRTYLEGSVVQHENGQDYQVDVNLVTKNVLNSSHEATSAKTLWSKTYRIPASAFRATGHKIADGVYEHLFHEKGLMTHSQLVWIERLDERSGYVYRLVRSDVDGTNKQIVYQSSTPISSFSIKKDGQRVAVGLTESKCMKIVAMNLTDGRNVQTLTECSEHADSPSFSPDGKRLAFTAMEKDAFAIKVFNLQSQKKETVFSHWSVNTEPSFTSDGNAILYTSGRSGGAQIYQYNFATKQVERQTFEGRYNTTASMSPDMQHMAYVHSRSGTLFIELMDLMTGERLLLGQSRQANESPGFAPNSKMLVYSTRGKGLRLSSVDGSVTLPLPKAEGSIIQVAWSPYLA